jgi:DNA-binding CsgD family transcriptional regulator
MQLLERGPIQVELSHLLHEAASGRGRVVFLGGEAGIGKTALVQRFAQVVSAKARVLSGACDPLSTPRPLGPLLDMQERLSCRYADLLTNGSDKDRLTRGFLAELSGNGRPCAVIIEDVHWADEATLDLLRFVARRIERAPALVIATYRNDEVPDRHPLRVLLGDLATTSAVRRLRLEPLSPAAVRRLAAATSLDALRLHEQTGGNPFFVTEVIAAGGAGIPPTVRDAVLARAARLPPEAREALDAAAVLGHRFEPALLEAVACPARGAVEACLAGGMLRVVGERLAFRHELARDAILAVLSSQRKAELHGRALAVLRSRQPGDDPDPGALAHHAEGAGDAAAVLEYAAEAARRAAALSAHREAAAQYARALRFASEQSATFRASLLEAMAYEQSLTGQVATAIDALRTAIVLRRESGERAREGDNLRFLSRLYWSLADPESAEATAKQAIELLEQLPAGRELSMAYSNWAGLRMVAGDWDAAIRVGERVVEIAERENDLVTLAHALNIVGCARFKRGDHEEGEAQLERSLRLSLSAGLEEHAARAYGNLGCLLAIHYRLEEAERYLSPGIAYCVEHDLEAQRLFTVTWLATVRVFQCRWAEARELAGAVTTSTDIATPRIHALVALARVAMRTGDADPGPILDEALELARRSGEMVRVVYARAARAEAAWLAGDLPRVRHEARADLRLATRHHDPRFAADLLFWLARAGERVDVPEGSFLPFRLELEEAWEDAAVEWRRLGCAYEAADALVQTGEPAHLRAALDEFRRLGAHAAERLTVRRLSELGVRKIPRGPRHSTRRNPANLTVRQLEVVRLLAEGCSNAKIAKRLFISPKTAGHHVSAVLSKLSVQTRFEAAREAVRLGIAQDREPRVPD